MRLSVANLLEAKKIKNTSQLTQLLEDGKENFKKEYKVEDGVYYALRSFD